MKKDFNKLTDDELIKIAQEGIKKEYIKDLKPEKVEEDLARGFEITREENARINAWCEKHIQENHWDKRHNRPKSFGAVGGAFTFCFTPTGIGVIGKVKCICGEEFCFAEL